MKTIDLNCDVAEGIGNEAELLPYISSCNIACGLHAGNDQTIREVIDLAINNDVAIGGHPAYDDRANFGRTEVYLPSFELKDLVKGQILKLKGMAESAGGHLHHIKPHGALYNMAAKSAEISGTIVSAVEEIDTNLILFGLAQSETEAAAKGRLKFVSEGFADRKYQSMNQLTPRSEDGLLTEIEEIKTHVLGLLVDNQVAVESGFESLRIESLCVHGDTPKAVSTVKEIYDLLIVKGFEIKSIEG